MKRILSLIAVLVFCAVFVNAADQPDVLTFEWTKNANLDGKDVNGVTGYRIYRDPSTEVQFVFPDILQDANCNIADKPGKCVATVPNIKDGRNHRYVATAYNDTGESDFSTPADVVIPVEKTPQEPIDQAPATPAGYMHLLIPIEVVK